MRSRIIATFLILAAGPAAAQAPPPRPAVKPPNYDGVAAWSKANTAYQAGLKAFSQSKGEEAIARFTEALEIIPKFTDARFARGRTYHEMKRAAPAYDDFTQVIQERKIDPDAYYYRALSLWNLNRREEAIKDLDTALAQRPRDYFAHENRGMLHEQLKNYPAALADFDMMVALQPLAPSNLNRRAGILRKMDQKALADADEAAAVRLGDAGF